MKTISNFVKKVSAVYGTGAATEHSYRSAIEALFVELDDKVTALNEPKRIACGAPDFIIQRGDLAIGHLEAKDIDVDLRSMKDANKKQQERYRKALPNLVYTNCLDWDFYRDGERIASVTIADFLLGIQPKPDEFERLESLLREFLDQRPQTISSPRQLAEMMAGKAILIKDVLHRALKADEHHQSELSDQYGAFKEHLIHDITLEDFSDIYAETIAYGMFAARLHDTTPDTFDRQEALQLLPKSNPFLRSLFGYLAGEDLDDRIAWIIDDLAAVFQAANMRKIMGGFGKLTGQRDPFLHFYETFLAAYNPKKRKARGVWYTPEPVVQFIVRAVDDVLQSEFGLVEGLADTSKISIDWDTGQVDKKGKPLRVKKEVHRVQILDPATGTGTFLAEVIRQIAPKVKEIAESVWSPYIETNLIPRLHGFELLMASYAMCHMKMDMMLSELGYKPTESPPRLSVYLTNSLEEGEPANQTLPFAQWLSNEVKQANAIKRDMPIMCVMGNPPYSGESANKGPWISGLLDAYKKEPGGKLKLKERNPKWLNDDYVKFIRLSEYFIERNGQGILGFITNHGYLDNPTFRGMRWHLLKTFDKLYVIDLHGNTKRKEVAPDGLADVNVFDIQQGVAIIIGVKTGKGTKDDLAKKPLAKVFHLDLWGARASKYDRLTEGTLAALDWNELELVDPQYVLTPRDYAKQETYDEGFRLDELMAVNSNGIVTARDALTIDTDKDRLWKRVQDFASLAPEEARNKYGLKADVEDWTVTSAQGDLKASLPDNKIVRISYRPFETAWTYYTGVSRGFHCRPRTDVMQHYLLGENIGLLVSKAVKDHTYAHAFVTENISEAIFLSATTGSNAMNFPLYLYSGQADLHQARQVNFDLKLYAKMKKLANHSERGEPTEIQVLDYIYGALHCPDYRNEYSQFLKTGYPRIPWPKTPDLFWDVSDKGAELRSLHLMKPDAIGSANFPLRGNSESKVGDVLYKNGQVWINSEQYFDNVPVSAWETCIGSYQPARKWLKDRNGQALSFDEIKHYQRILKVLSETDRIINTITLEKLSEKTE